MKLLIHGRNLEVTSSLREYTKSKIEKAIHHFEEMVKEADVHLSVAKNQKVPQQTAEVTLFANGTVIRAQERSQNLYASIDLVSNKLCRQLKKYKERHNNNNHENHESLISTLERDLEENSINGSLLDGKEAKLPNPGIRRKYFPMNPMSIYEAMHQLDLIDHDFYLFKEEKSGELQVIYRRKHGGYGVIQSKT